MKFSPSLLAAALTVACVGRSMTTSLSGTSPAPTPDAFACVRAQLKALEFDQSSIDLEEYRVTARKYDQSVRRPDTQFRRMVDRIEIDVAPGTGGAMTSMSVEAKTFAEHTTQRGPTEIQEGTSETARAAAHTVLQKCSQPVDSLSVPG